MEYKTLSQQEPTVIDGRCVAIWNIFYSLLGAGLYRDLLEALILHDAKNENNSIDR